MHTETQKNEFLSLRAQGLSFDKISEKLKINKKTLIRWNKERINEINSLKELAFESMMESLQVSTKNRIKLLADELNKLNAALDGRSYGSYNVPELLTFKMKLISELSKLDSTFKSFLKKDLDVSAEELKLDDITNLQPDSDLQTCNTMKDFTKIMNNISAEHQTKLDFNIESNNDDDE
ncbi:MAG TPA: hypothetical protein VIK14_16880 [Ignavibacteria bacterium]